MIMAGMAEMSREAYDLRYWVQRGKLKWLDLSSPDLPLKSGPAEDFPYIEFHDFTGQRKAYHL
jgi:hypothetical protein